MAEYPELSLVKTVFVGPKEGLGQVDDPVQPHILARMSSQTPWTPSTFHVSWVPRSVPV
jgi:hypothetical protein